MAKKYTPDGEPIPDHEHDWVMVDVTIHPNPNFKRPVMGATVLWRCSKRNCHGHRKAQYKFRRPRVNQQPNSYSPSLDALLGGDVTRPIQSETAPVNN